MDSTFLITIYTSIITATVFIVVQLLYFVKTRFALGKFKSFFKHKSDYEIDFHGDEHDPFPQISSVGKNGSDLNALITEINTYLEKTKGTSDYEFIRNKVERKLSMLQDRSTTYLAFPTHIGLMGTFAGVLIGISMFLSGFDDAGNISDDSIKNLLTGVLVSMITSLIGLVLTTINSAHAGKARKKVEDDKNDFFDFLQTEVTKTASASLVYAISKLHETVDKFEPSFSTIIEGFKAAFNDCTRAFGEDFKQNVSAVTKAVAVMGENMDKINQNIDLQQKVLDTINSKEFIRGMDKYIEAANLLEGTAKSLGKFEEARKMMLAAAQETMNLQKTYSDSLKVPRDIAIELNHILNRITEFENNVNAVGRALNQREILGNDVVNCIEDQISAISRKSKIADSFLELADGKLEDMYKQQTKVLSQMNERYKNAIGEHIDGFEKFLSQLTDDLKIRHKEFMTAMEENLSIESIHQEFTNLRKLDSIEKSITSLASNPVKADDVKNGVMGLHEDVNTLKNDIKPQLTTIEKNIASIATSSLNTADIKKGVTDLQKSVNTFKDEIKPQLEAISSNTKTLVTAEKSSHRGWFGKHKDN